MKAHPKETSEDIESAGKTGTFIGDAGSAALTSAEILGTVAAFGGAGLAMPFIKFL